MKITKRQLRRIIEEELQRSLLAETQLYQGRKLDYRDGSKIGQAPVDAFVEQYERSFRAEKTGPDTASMQITQAFLSPGAPFVNIEFQVLGFVEG